MRRSRAATGSAPTLRLSRRNWPACAKLHGVDKARLVMDPFAGIGSSAIACAQMGVPFIGFEIDGTYVKAAKERLQSLICTERRW